MRVKLKDIASFSKGIQINGDDLLPDGQYDFLNGGIRPSGKWNAYNVNGDTVTISEGGNSSGYVNFMETPFWCGAHCYFLFDLKIDGKYLFYALKSQQNHIMKLRSGACMPNIKKSDLAEFEFYIDTDITKQKTVVNVLDKVDDLIEKHKQQLAKLDELVKARFVEMFGDPVKNTMNWPYKSLNSVCDGIGDGLHGTPKYDDNGNYPFINGNNLIDGRIVVTPATKMVAEDTYKTHQIDICENAILISINGTLGKLAFYRGEKVMLGKSACYCNLKPNINKVFVYGVMKSDAFADFLDKSSTKSTIKNVGLKAMREYQLILPPMKLQEQFAGFVEQTDKSKLTIQQGLDKLELLKKSSMQQYFGVRE